MTDALPPTGSIDDSCLRIFLNELREQGKRISVQCNGVELQQVVEYDCDRGFAIVNKLKDGKAFTEDGKTVARMRVEGAITVGIVDAG